MGKCKIEEMEDIVFEKEDKFDPEQDYFEDDPFNNYGEVYDGE